MAPVQAVNAPQPHLYVGISSHGYGHLAQVAPILNRLTERHHGLELTLATTLPESLLSLMIKGKFRTRPHSLDFGMHMKDALSVDLEKSFAAYVTFHEHFDDAADALAQELKVSGVDLVFSDVPYLLTEAARRADIPSVALCSLNWADIFHGYFAGRAGMHEIEDVMREAYESCKVFFMPQPSMPMLNLSRRIAIGPVAMTGCNRREILNDLLHLSPDDRLVLVNLGGIPFEIDFRIWPREENLHYLVDTPVSLSPWLHALPALDMRFNDILASCDVLLTKPGYGNFVGAACHGVGVLYVRRLDWPEEPYLVSWLKEHARCCEISQERLETGQMSGPIKKLFEQPEKPKVEPKGIDEACQVIESFFGGFNLEGKKSGQV
ncbi:MAG: hypothetical protein KGI54_12915 [Pseudomonadota bacterium]|nr:hypothetical protein [Pseudomonadota bacterium]